MATILIALPFAFAALCLATPGARLRLTLLLCGAWVHLGATAYMWLAPTTDAVSAGFVAFDPLGRLFVTLISVLFAAVSVYFVGYHRQTLASQRVFLACMLGLLGALTLVCASQHLGLLWVALEACTLAATPLIYFRLGPRALAAGWKFLLLNSVGIAIALLGVFCIALATTPSTSLTSLMIGDLVRYAAELDPVWLRAGFLLALVGFGTKLGLAPMHTWKPDVYGESPPPIAALMAGAVTLAAFLGIVRVFEVCVAAGYGAFASAWVIAFGLFSIALAAVLLVGQLDYRRLVAYTSVEHVGVLAVGLGLGVAGGEAAMLHAMHNTFAKGALFFLAGFLWRQYGTNSMPEMAGVMGRQRVAGILLLAGVCATCAAPPFGMFFSELGVVLAAAAEGRWIVLSIFVLCLGVAFVAVVTGMLPLIFGQPASTATSRPPTLALEGWRRRVLLSSAAVLLALSFGLGAYQPAPVREALRQAARTAHPTNAVALTRVDEAEGRR